MCRSLPVTLSVKTYNKYCNALVCPPPLPPSIDPCTTPFVLFLSFHKAFSLYEDWFAAFLWDQRKHNNKLDFLHLIFQLKFSHRIHRCKKLFTTSDCCIIHVQAQRDILNPFCQSDRYVLRDQWDCTTSSAMSHCLVQWEVIMLRN